MTVLFQQTPKRPTRAPMSVLYLEMSQVFQRQGGLKLSCRHEVPLFDSQAAENWEAGENPALPPQR